MMLKSFMQSHVLFIYLGKVLEVGTPYLIYIQLKIKDSNVQNVLINKWQLNSLTSI